MKIISSPYQATIVPQPVRADALWNYTIRHNGSSEILVRQDATRKEDACCMALLEISRLKREANRSESQIA
jgi:hypothetical protein